MRAVRHTASTLLALAALVAPAGAWSSGLQVSDRKLDVAYLYSLSTTTGTIPFADVRLSWDEVHRELWVVTGTLARVFNAGGMELFSFGADPEMGSPYAVAGLEDGDLAVLTHAGGGWRVLRCNFRGEPQAVIEITGGPENFLEDLPTVLAARGERLYIVSKSSMKVLVTDLSGKVVAARDFAAELDLAEKRADLGLGGFGVDREGNMLFTIRPLFTAVIAPPQGEPIQFGIKGSAPGKFQVLGDIARDDQGFVYVADVLKSAVIVFDKDLKFVTEFGYRGGRPSNLISPEELVVTDGRVFVSQRAKRGVSVFKVSSDEPRVAASEQM